MGYNDRLVLEFLLHAYDFTGAAAEERQEISPTLRAEEKKALFIDRRQMDGSFICLAMNRDYFGGAN